MNITTTTDTNKDKSVAIDIKTSHNNNRDLIKKSFKIKFSNAKKAIEFALNDEEGSTILDEVHKFYESGVCDILESKDIGDTVADTITLETHDVYTRRLQLQISKTKIDVYFDLAQSVVPEITEDHTPEELIPNWQYDCTINDWAKIYIGKGTDSYGEFLEYQDKKDKSSSSDWTYGNSVLIVYKDDAKRKRPDFSKSKLLCAKCTKGCKDACANVDHQKDDTNTDTDQKNTIVTTVTFISSSIYTFNLSPNETIVDFTSVVHSYDLPLATLVTNQKTYFLNHMVWIDNSKLSKEEQTSTIAIILNPESYLEKRKNGKFDDSDGNVLFTMGFTQNIYAKFISKSNKQKLVKKSKMVKLVQQHHPHKDVSVYYQFYKQKLASEKILYPTLPRIVLTLM